jgi:hypothetical protein
MYKKFKYLLVLISYSDGTMKQVKFYIDEERYEKLKKLADEQGLSVPSYVKNLVLRVLGEFEGKVEDKIKYLIQRKEQLEKEVGRIGVELALLNRRVEKLEQELYRKS